MGSGQARKARSHRGAVAVASVGSIVPGTARHPGDAEGILYPPAEWQRKRNRGGLTATAPAEAAHRATRAGGTGISRSVAWDGSTDRPPAARRNGSGSTPATLANSRDLGWNLSSRRPGPGHPGARWISHRGRAELPVR